MSTRGSQRGGLAVGVTQPRHHTNKTDHDRRNHELLKRLASDTTNPKKVAPSATSATEGVKERATRTSPRRKTEVDPSNKSFLRQTSSSALKMSQGNGDHTGKSNHDPGKKIEASPRKSSSVGVGRKGSSAGDGSNRQSQVFERLSKVDSNKNPGRGGSRGHQLVMKKLLEAESPIKPVKFRRRNASPSKRPDGARNSDVSEEDKDAFTEKHDNLPETVDKDLEDVLVSCPAPSNATHHSASPTPSTTTPTVAPPSTPLSVSKSPKQKTLQKTKTKVVGKKSRVDKSSREAKVGGAEAGPKQRGTTEATSRSEVLQKVRARVGDGRPPAGAAEVRDADKDVCEADMTDEEREFYKISVRTRLVTYDNSTLVIRNTSKASSSSDSDLGSNEDDVEQDDDDESVSETSFSSSLPPTPPPTTDLQTSSGEVTVGNPDNTLPDPVAPILNPNPCPEIPESAEAGRAAVMRKKITLMVNRGRAFLADVYSATHNRLEQYTKPTNQSSCYPSHLIRPYHQRDISDSGYYSLPPPLVETNPLWGQDVDFSRLSPELSEYLGLHAPNDMDSYDEEWENRRNRKTKRKHRERAEEDMVEINLEPLDGTEVNEGDTGGERIIVDEEWIKKNILCTCRCRQRRTRGGDGEFREGQTGDKTPEEPDTREQGGSTRGSEEQDNNTREAEEHINNTRTGGTAESTIDGTSLSSADVAAEFSSLSLETSSSSTHTNSFTNPDATSCTPAASIVNLDATPTNPITSEANIDVIILPTNLPTSSTSQDDRDTSCSKNLPYGDENEGECVENEAAECDSEEKDGESVESEAPECDGDGEEFLCYCSCHEGEWGEGSAAPHQWPQEVQDLLDADHARMWWTITGNFGNILPIDWSKTYTRQQYLPVLNLNHIKEGSSSEDEGVEEGSSSPDTSDPPTRPCPPHLYADKLRSMSVGALNEALLELELVVRQYSETLISQLALRDELEYEKELKNSFISLLLQVQNKRRNFSVEKKKQKKVGPNGTDPKYLTTVIPYDVGHGPPHNPTLQILIKILTAINEDSPTVPTLLTDYILKVLCPS